MKFRAATLALLAAITLAGCGSHKSSGASGASGLPTDTASGIPTEETSPSDSATDTDSTTDTSQAPVVTTPPPSKPVVSKPPTNLAPCAPPSLTAVEKTANGGLSHAGYVIVYTYHGQIPCHLTGYPGLAILNASGKQVIQAARTPSGYLGGIRNGKPPFPTVVLNAGQSASALLEGLLFDPNTSKGCPVEHALLTTPPSTTVAIKVAATTTICAQVQIHPIVAGSTGSKP